ncbi:stalk domain-containing protein [Fictibacillus nanhaiensis]|uniref:stalk domain-containing protein n=1 Tax=Fictibacillus nanhaiensis TaxID=742169 RepID=UPI002E230A50|nr:stalk domain-containing protein [Fictibacillus nanhaiensis]
MRLRSKVISFGIGLSLTLSPLTFSEEVAASSSISLYMNGAKQQYDQQPIIKENRALVPIRAVSEGLGASVTYQSSDKTVRIKKDRINITLKVGSKTANINGMKKVLDVPAQAINNRTLVPLRFVGETLHAKVAYDSKSKSVHITGSEFTKFVEANQEKVVTITKLKHGLPYINKGAGVVVSPSLILTTQSAVNQAEGAYIETVKGEKVQVEGIVEMDLLENLALVKLASPITIKPVNVHFSNVAKGQKAVVLDASKGTEVKVDGFENRLSEQLYTKTPYINSFIGTPLFNYEGDVIGLSSELDLDNSIEYYEAASKVEKWKPYFSMSHSDIKTSGFFHKLPLSEMKTITDVSLGMNDAEVQSLQKGDIYVDSKFPYLSYKNDDTIAPGGYASFEFHRKERILNRISYQYSSETMTQNEAASLFNEMKANLEKLHGTPYTVDMDWNRDEDNQYRNLYVHWLPKFNEEKPVVRLSVEEDTFNEAYRFELYYYYGGTYRK